MRTLELGLWAFILAVGSAACGDPAARPDADADGASDTPADADADAPPAYHVLQAAAWGAAPTGFELALPAVVAGLGRPGAALAPEALVADAAGLFVLDPVGGRVVRVSTDGGTVEVEVEDAALVGARDLARAPDGTLWVETPAATLRAIVPGGGARDVALAPDLVGRPLLVDGSGAVYVGEPDGHDVALVSFEGRDVPVDEQIDVGSPRVGSPLAFGRHVRLAEPPTHAIDLVDPWGDAARVPLPGRPSAVRLFGLGCGGTLVVVVGVTLADGPADVVLRLDLSDGHVLFEASARAPEPFHTPRRAFALIEAGRLYQLRLTEAGHALVEWDLRCP